MFSSRLMAKTKPEPRARLLWLACALAAVGKAPAPAQVTEAVLHNFASPPTGANPNAGVIRDAAGNLYGTAIYGGSENAGVVYKLDTTGSLTVLYSFTGGADGASPYAGVIRDSAGNLYGTTAYGGTAGAGVVYKLDKTGLPTVLYSFTGGADGAYPYAGVIRDSSGNLYGTTHGGGIAAGFSGAGVVYMLDTTGRLTVLYSFTGAADGSVPNAGVIRDSKGNLYGTTLYGGTDGAGVVYKLNKTGQLKVLHSFTGGGDGAYPYSGVIRDSSGNLYGTTYHGGTAGAGVIYKLDKTRLLTPLYSFTGGSDGSNPIGGVIRDSTGNLYGTTYYGGTTYTGLVYELDTAGSLNVLYNFTGGADGAYSDAGVISDPAGNLYGTTANGGAASGTGGMGVVFELDATGHQTVLYGFTEAAGGYGTNTGVIRDSAGNLYGTAPLGGAANAGIVYKLDTTGTETVLYSFTGGADGGLPKSGVIRDSAGNLYGTTYSGGTAGVGVVYVLDTTGKETVLYTFTGADGANPSAGVVRDSAGNLYGTTQLGGAAYAGVVYKVDTTGVETVLYSFTGGADGSQPYSGVIRDAAGNLYGTASSGGASGFGVVYKLNAAANYSVLYSFTGGADGAIPYAGVVRDSSGNLYGTTELGGAAGAGVVYELTAGQETVLYNFTGGADGGQPWNGVIRDATGNLYGVTPYGGTANAGVVYQLDTTGAETVLYNFTGSADGSHPYGGVIRDSAGNLYGTASVGGKSNGGVVFKLKGA